MTERHGILASGPRMSFEPDLPRTGLLHHRVSMTSHQTSYPVPESTARSSLDSTSPPFTAKLRLLPERETVLVGPRFCPQCLVWGFLGMDKASLME